MAKQNTIQEVNQKHNQSLNLYELSDQAVKLRKGFTTGSCATAASKAALIMLSQTKVSTIDAIDIELPDASKLTVPVAKITRNDDGSVTCTIVKDAGDDHDVTNQLEIEAIVEWTHTMGDIDIRGGKGVGIVTKSGLQIPIGHAAINPIPLKMIRHNLRPLLDGKQRVRVTICVPKGEEIALKTFNPRLGIEGGISIIGTTGIVRPMSEDAFKSTIYTELSQKKSLGVLDVVLVPGQHGEKYAIEHQHISIHQIVHVGNFVGFGLSAAQELGFHSIYLVGHIGKYVKLAGGIFNTHSKVADAKSHIIITYFAMTGAPTWKMKEIFLANTTDEISDRVHQWGDEGIFQDIANAAKTYCTDYILGKCAVDILMYDMKGRCLCNTKLKPQEES